MKLKEVEKYVYSTLEKNLSPTLTYHGLHHTKDVVEATERIAKVENIISEEEITLLKTAALFHDIGFISTYKNHEEESSRIASHVLKNMDYSAKQITVINQMIMATKIPQKPKTMLDKILADADLDYLGRDDFEPISQTLFQELYTREMVADIDAWNHIQIKFLENHRYWTDSMIKLRTHEKNKRLVELKKLMGFRI